MERDFSSVDRLLVLLCLADFSPAEEKEIWPLLNPEQDWKGLWDRITLNDVAPLVYLNLKRLRMFSSVPGGLRKRLEARYRQVKEANEARLTHARDLFRRFAIERAQVIPLKGVLFAETIYGDVAYKRMNDLDILVRFDDVAIIKNVYDKMGLFPLALLEGGNEDPDPRKTHHLPAYVSRDLAFIVGTHWGLTSPKKFRIDHDQMWKRAVRVTVAGEPVAALSMPDNLLHLCVHFHYYKTGLKELADFANLIRSRKDFSWDAFAERIEEVGAQTAAYRPLKLVETIFQLGIPREFFERITVRADAWVVRDTDQLASRKDLLLMSRSTYSSQIEKAYLRFTFEIDLRKKWDWFLLFWRRLLWPPREILYRTNACLPGERSLRYLVLMNLWRTGREIGKDFGLAIFFLIMIKSLFELFQCGVATLFGARTEDKMASVKQILGDDEGKIQQLMDAME